MSDQTPHDPIPAAARAANLALWNAWTKVHEASAYYDVEGFKVGKTSLWPLELEELGPSVGEGTKLLHLQCHFGLDTLSWARRGADVVGLDLSDEAITLARRLAEEVGLSRRARFILSDLYAADEHLGGELFDVVFTSWGALEWLPDLDRWAGIVARHLAPGGTFYMAELHPLYYSFDEIPGEQQVRIRYRLLPDPSQPDIEPIEGSYADRDAATEGLTSYGWAHSFAEIITSLTGAGLRIEHLHEFPFSPAPSFDWMKCDDDRWWWLPDGKGGRRRDLPLTFSLRARKPRPEEG